MSKLSILLVAIVMLVGSVSLSGKNIFNTADYLHHALESAKSNRKLLLTYAASPSTPSSIAMENATFRDPKILNLLSSNYYPIKVNLLNKIGQSWVENFQIVHSPTLLFFDEHGTLIKQVENAVSSKELESILNEVLFFQENGFWPIESGDRVVLPAIVIDHVDHQPSTEVIEEKSPANQNSSSLPTPVINEKKEVIRVLLGQFATKDPRIEDFVRRTKEEFPEYSVHIKLVKNKKESYYQVCIGNFNKLSDAQLHKDSVLRQGFDNAKVIIRTVERVR